MCCFSNWNIFFKLIGLVAPCGACWSSDTKSVSKIGFIPGPKTFYAAAVAVTIWFLPHCKNANHTGVSKSRFTGVSMQNTLFLYYLLIIVLFICISCLLIILYPYLWFIFQVMMAGNLTYFFLPLYSFYTCRNRKDFNGVCISKA